MSLVGDTIDYPGEITFVAGKTFHMTNTTMRSVDAETRGILVAVGGSAYFQSADFVTTSQGGSAELVAAACFNPTEARGVHLSCAS